MAFPSVRSSSSEANVVGSGGQAWTMPASITAGDLLVAIFYKNVVTGTLTGPAGWTADGNNPYESRGYLFFKVAAGSDTCSISNTDTIGIAGTIVSVQDWSGTIATDLDVSVAAANNPDPVTAGWGSDDNLFVEGYGAAGGTLPSVSAWSTNYTEINKATGDYGTDVFSGAAYRQLASASDNPDAITDSGGPGSDSSWTIVIKPVTGTALTLTPNADGTITTLFNEVHATTNLYQSIDEDPDTPTLTDWVTSGEGDGNGFFELSAMPGGFSAMLTPLTVRADVASTDFAADTAVLYAQVFAANESTNYTDEVSVATQASSGLVEVNLTVNATGLAASKTAWNAARLRLRWDYTA